ncbi:MAG: hypothetical protein ACJAVO_002315 [Parvibaculaceae bacterium]|jgi:hypothetical protein
MDPRDKPEGDAWGGAGGFKLLLPNDDGLDKYDNASY